MKPAQTALTPLVSRSINSQGWEDVSHHVPGQRGVPQRGMAQSFWLFQAVAAPFFTECLHPSVEMRFPIELRRSPYLRTSPLRRSPRTLWTIRVLWQRLEAAFLAGFGLVSALCSSSRGRTDRRAAVPGDLQGPSSRVCVSVQGSAELKTLLLSLPGKRDLYRLLRQRQEVHRKGELSSSNPPSSAFRGLKYGSI